LPFAAVAENAKKCPSGEIANELVSPGIAIWSRNSRAPPAFEPPGERNMAMAAATASAAIVHGRARLQIGLRGSTATFADDAAALESGAPLIS